MRFKSSAVEISSPSVNVMVASEKQYGGKLEAPIFRDNVVIGWRTKTKYTNEK